MIRYAIVLCYCVASYQVRNLIPGCAIRFLSYRILYILPLSGGGGDTVGGGGDDTVDSAPGGGVM